MPEMDRASWHTHLSIFIFSSEEGSNTLQLSSQESWLTRRSMNHDAWGEGWVVQKILYARCRVSGERKAY